MDLIYRWLADKVDEILEAIRASFAETRGSPSTSEDQMTSTAVLNPTTSFKSAIAYRSARTHSDIRKNNIEKAKHDEHRGLNLSNISPPRVSIEKLNLMQFKKNESESSLQRVNLISNSTTSTPVRMIIYNHSDQPLSENSVQEGVSLHKMENNDDNEDNDENEVKYEILERPPRRKRIPDRPNISSNLKSVLKNFVGRELGTIPMPVSFNEPLSMLQRISECFEYSELLDQASELDDPLEQLAYIAAFTVSTYSSTVLRMTKPFKPLLGETYEFDRTDDLGWRLIAEQVSHHPPISVLYCESKRWRCIQMFESSLTFNGRSIVINPKGKVLLEFLRSGRRYTWNRAITAVKNIIFGPPYIDNYGEVVVNHESPDIGPKCHLKYFPYSIFYRDNLRKIEGEILDEDNEVRFLIKGHWDQQVDVIHLSEDVPEEERRLSNNIKIIWTRRMPEPESENYYHFSVFACQLNELEPHLAPTDSRLRPDQRLLELGLWAEASEEKTRLEQKQRAVRKQIGPNYVHVPAWFKMREEDNEIVYEYGGEYWECKQKQDWSRCPNIF